MEEEEAYFGGAAVVVDGYVGWGSSPKWGSAENWLVMVTVVKGQRVEGQLEEEER